ncbi:hypothetical protein [Rhodobacteraceae bacterium DSL-40]|uniref:hypothetical protein n=1 Tax=Amaricoccus sp. B4 TaxID=3368557 RepID=UPI000DAE8E62
MTGEARPAGRPRVEIGWLLLGPGLGTARQPMIAAAEEVMTRLSRLFPGFDWRHEIVERGEMHKERAIEPVMLLDEAEIVRTRRRLDYVFVLTTQDLVAYTRPATHAVLSHAFGAAIISTARLVDGNFDAERMSARIVALAMNLFGRLNGLAPDTGGAMGPFDRPRDLDTLSAEDYSREDTEHLSEVLADVADLRVEETEAGHSGALAFYARALWVNRRALPRGILRMRPWEFPLRFNRLTTAAASALAVLMMTAESWDVALRLPVGTVVATSLAALIATSGWVLKSQRLLARPGERGLMEQRVVSNTSAAAAVGIGMAVTYLAVFGASLLMALVFFGDALLGSWVSGDFTENFARVRMAGFCAALSLGIGALGASFEPYGYFRQVTFIDDEL